MAVTFPYTAAFLDGTAYPNIGSGSTTVNVSSSSALTTALANAAPGHRIVLANGTYSGAFTLANKAGTTSAPISVEAGTTGGAVFASGSTFSITGSSAYIKISGLAFPYELSSGNLVQFRGSTHHCQITRCLFGPSSIGTPGANKSPFIYMGDDTNFIRIDHNEFRNKANPGNTILGDGNFTTFQVVKHIRIDHNYIHDIRPEVNNEKEPIRLGVSTMSKTMSYSVIERNVFVGCICEPEVISVKCGGVRVSGNTILRSIGGPVYRHGTDGVMSDNYVVDNEPSTPPPPPSGGITSTTITSVVALTQAQYDALGTKDPHTLYYTTSNASSAGPTTAVVSNTITSIVALTSSAYNALSTKSATTLYVVTGTAPSAVPAASVTSTTIDTVVVLTQAQYNALSSVNPRNLYLIAG